MITRGNIATSLMEKEYNIAFKDFSISDHHVRCIEEMFVYKFPNTKCLVRYKYESPDKENPEVSRIILIGTTDLKKFMEEKNYEYWINYKLRISELNIAHNHEPISSYSSHIYRCCHVKNIDDIGNLKRLIGINVTLNEEEIDTILRNEEAKNLSELISRGQELELEEFIRILEAALKEVDYADRIFAEISKKASELPTDKQHPRCYETIYGKVAGPIMV